MNTTILSSAASVAALGAMKKNSSKCNVENNNAYEWVFMFIFGIMLAGGYVLTPENKWAIVDFVYLVLYFICQMAIYTAINTDKKNRKAVCILSAILAGAMLIPFIMDMDAIYVHQCVSAFGIGTEGNVKMHYIYKDYTDYVQLVLVVIMYVWCIFDMARPIVKLLKK